MKVNTVHSSRIKAAEMNCLRGSCGVSRWDGIGNTEVKRDLEYQKERKTWAVLSQSGFSKIP